MLIKTTILLLLLPPLLFIGLSCISWKLCLCLYVANTGILFSGECLTLPTMIIQYTQDVSKNRIWIPKLIANVAFCL